VQAYSPLGTPGYKESDEPNVLQDPVLNKMAKKYNRSVAQVCLKWALQRGTSVVVKSSSLQHQLENLAIANEHDAWTLSEDDMEEIASTDKGYRFFRPEDWWGEMSMAVFN
jgi:diketogulonate reductase-like aldo/keto reductase